MDLSLSSSLVGSATLNPDKLSLDLQFATDKTLVARRGPTPTFTRASTATFVGSDGLIQSAAINEPRFDHDPITLDCKGLLIEESRTNLLAYSEQMDNAYWTKGSVTIVDNDQISPDGNLNADTITAAASSVSSLYRAVSCVASTAYTLSFYIKIDTLTPNEFKFAIRDDTNGVFIDQSITPNVTPVTTEWRRVVYTFTTPVGCVLVRPYLSRFSSTIEGTFSIWGVQLEQGSFPTSYIPTTTTSVVRSEDVCSITGSDFTGFYNNDQGTMVATASAAGFTSNKNTVVVAIESGTTGVMRIYHRVAFGNRLSALVAGVQLTPASNYNTANVIYKSALAAGVDGADYVIDGTQIPDTYTGSVLTADNLKFSGVVNSTSNTTISSFRYYKKRLATAKLVSLTS